MSTKLISHRQFITDYFSNMTVCAFLSNHTAAVIQKANAENEELAHVAEALLHTVPACGDFAVQWLGLSTSTAWVEPRSQLPCAWPRRKKKINRPAFVLYPNCTKAPPTVNHLGHRKRTEVSHPAATEFANFRVFLKPQGCISPLFCCVFLFVTQEAGYACAASAPQSHVYVIIPKTHNS